MDPKQKNALSLAATVVLVALAVWLFWPPGEKINQALDIKGGMSVILTAETTGGVAPTAEQMNRAEIIIGNRVNGLGLSEASVQMQGQDSLLVQLPGVKDSEQALKALGSTGRLEFVDVASITDSAAVAAIQGNTGGFGSKVATGSYAPLMTGEVITNASVGTNDQNQITVNLTMNQAGRETWGAYTTSHIGKQVAILLDGIVQSAPVVQSAITDGNTEISGKFTPDEAKRLAAVLEAGALPVELVPQDTRIVGPTLGQQSLRQGLLAGLAGVALVLIYMTVYYRGLGLLSWASLFIFATLYLGSLALLSRLNVFALSLPGIAGVVLSIGVATDTNVLIFERFKEEVDLGKTYRSAAKSGTRHALLTSIDADLVTVVSAVVIYLVAIGPVRGFAFTLLMGIALDLGTAMLFTRPMLQILSESLVPKMPALFGVAKGGGRDA